MKADQKIHILLMDNCGVSSSDLSRHITKYRIQADFISSTFDKQSAGSADGIILDAKDYDKIASASDLDFTAVLVLGSSDQMGILLSSCISAGFLVGDRAEPSKSLPSFLALCFRLRAIHLREHSLQRRLDDTRFVNRAKLLLMERLQMTEGQAHRYIEKTAMDSGICRRDVAVSIIRTYEQ